ncbi:MAG: hypothetical protein GY747_09770 [Planctomycetes bacterium]|nr:hypothetical protein [Planctomycetota bacterium]MCP4771681.1 hypothetical protein [Planctomycetota bacterium]MCP4860019.1 hypothetical protein [Planctomycetota bacterium]
MKTHLPLATLVALGLCAAPIAAQELELEKQSPNTEDSLSEAMLNQNFPGFMGGGGSGFTSRFDSSFNPAMGLVLDSVANFSEEVGDEADSLELRSVEMNLASRIDPFGWAYVVAAFEEGEFALEEAVLIMDQLPANMSLRVGRMLSDFGKWNTLHLHDKSFIFEDGVRQEFFGGNLNMTGLELHQWTGWGDMPVRWSLGVASSFGGHGHGHGEEEGGHEHMSFESGVIDNRGVEEMGFNGRLTTQQDFGQNGFLQYGVSFFHTPEGLVDEHDHDSDGIIDESFGLGQTTIALDFTLRDVDATTRTADTLSMELWHNSREGVNEVTDAIESHDANGIWGFYQHDFDPFWGGGVMAAWWQEAGNEQSSDWFTGAEAGSQRAIFVTRNFSEFNRMRLQVTENVPTDGETSWSLALQWDVILGSHSHPMDW